MATAAAVTALGAIFAAEFLYQDGAEVTAGALISTFLQVWAADQFLELARDYYTLYDDQRQFYYNNFQNNPNGELGLLTQVFVNPLAGNGQPGSISYTPQYTAQSANVAFFSSTGAFSSVWWQNHANMYNDIPFTSGNTPTGAGGAGEPETLDKAATIADFDMYFDRYEEHRRDVYNERTWEWQNQSLNFGIKQANIVESGLATSFKFLDESMGNMADFFGAQANGLSMQSAYKRLVRDGGQQLAASTQRGRGLAVSSNLGVDMRNDSIFNSSFEQQQLRSSRVE